MRLESIAELCVVSATTKFATGSHSACKAAWFHARNGPVLCVSEQTRHGQTRILGRCHLPRIADHWNTMLCQSKKPMDHVNAASEGEIWCVQRLLAEGKTRVVPYLVLSICDGWLGDGLLTTVRWMQCANLSGGVEPAAVWCPR